MIDVGLLNVAFGSGLAAAVGYVRGVYDEDFLILKKDLLKRLLVMSDCRKVDGE